MPAVQRVYRILLQGCCERLEPDIGKLICPVLRGGVVGNAAPLLDAQKFQNIKNALGEAFETSLDSIKWKLWHGKVSDALTKLTLLRENITDEEQSSKMTGLYDYIKRNQSYLVNYEERDNAKKPYTSQVAESHVDTLINARHKKTRKMQWTREGAHHVLQIRAMIASEAWSSKWQNAVLSSLKDAV